MEARLIYDTGSDWLVVEGADCKKCSGQLYDPQASSFFEQVDSRTESKTYGSFMSVKGLTVKDQVCLIKKDVCVDPMYFFLVSDQTGIPDDADGIFGLAQGEFPRGFNMPKYYNVGELYLTYLRFLGHIREKSFSTHFTGENGYSWVDFGPQDESAMSSISV